MTYNNSVVYKIECKNPVQEIKDIYIGSTINIEQRKTVHYSNYYNIDSPYYALKVYSFIRSNGGFNNFHFVTIEEYPCDDKKELRKRERYYQDLYKPTLCNNRAYITYDEKLISIKQYYIKYKNEINTYRNGIYNCDHCDKTFTLRNKSTHKKTKYCMSYK
jgi:hypothetical protein